MATYGLSVNRLDGASHRLYNYALRAIHSVTRQYNIYALRAAHPVTAMKKRVEQGDKMILFDAQMDKCGRKDAGEEGR